MAKSGVDRKPQISFTDELKRDFLLELKRTCNITKASKKINISRITAYSAKKANPEFSDAWDNALSEGLDLLEKMAMKRAFEGYPKNIYYQGKKIATEYEYSDGLAMFILAAHRPEKYRDKQQGIDSQQAGGVLVVPASMSLGEWMKKNEISMECSVSEDNSK
jgi:hypothetical protein